MTASAGARALVWGLPLMACGAVLEQPTSPPPAGMPTLVSRLEVTLEAVEDPETPEDDVPSCAALGAGFVPGPGRLSVTQDGVAVQATFVSDAAETPRALVLRGCVTSDGDGRFQVRLGGVARSTVTEGASRCVGRIAVPPERIDAMARARGEAEYRAAETEFLDAVCAERDDVRFPTEALDLCEDGRWVGALRVMLDWQGEACSGLVRCRATLALTALPTSGGADLPAGTLLGGPCAF